MTDQKEFDVRPLLPIKRHEKLLKTFKELPAGDSFVFINDHDPKPLYYEFRSVFGDVVEWEYLKREPEEWKVRVGRISESAARDMDGISTLLDLRKTDVKDWKYSIFHRYSMMREGDTMKLMASEEPLEIRKIFESKFRDEHLWEVQEKSDSEWVIHITRTSAGGSEAEDVSVVNKFDVRPHPPAKRHEMVFEAFNNLRPGEAFVFINDHDPKPLYYQMEAESQEPFKWEYLLALPEEWKVKVLKVKDGQD